MSIAQMETGEIRRCIILLNDPMKFMGRDMLTVCFGKERRGPIKEIIDLGREMSVSFYWMAEKLTEPKSIWVKVANISIDLLREDAITWQSDGKIEIKARGYSYAAIMPERNNLDPRDVSGWNN